MLESFFWEKGEKREIHKERRKPLVPMADPVTRKKSCKSAMIFPESLTSNSWGKGFSSGCVPSRIILGQYPADRGQLSVYSAVTVFEPLVSSSVDPPVNGAFSQ